MSASRIVVVVAVDWSLDIGKCSFIRTLVECAESDSTIEQLGRNTMGKEVIRTKQIEGKIAVAAAVHGIYNICMCVCIPGHKRALGFCDSTAFNIFIAWKKFPA